VSPSCRRTSAVLLAVLAIGRSMAAHGEDLAFGTRNGKRKPENPNNILRRHVYPACDALKLRRATWLTLRRNAFTYAASIVSSSKYW
jgi:hypothetical protein